MNHIKFVIYRKDKLTHFPPLKSLCLSIVSGNCLANLMHDACSRIFVNETEFYVSILAQKVVDLPFTQRNRN